VRPSEPGRDCPPRIMPVRPFIARNLAASFLAGAWSSDQLLERGRSAFLHRSRSLGPLIQNVMAAFPGPDQTPDIETLAAFIENDRGFDQAWQWLRRRGLWPGS